MASPCGNVAPAWKGDEKNLDMPGTAQRRGSGFEGGGDYNTVW